MADYALSSELAMDGRLMINIYKVRTDKVKI